VSEELRHVGREHAWDIDRLTEERTEAVSAFGFTERQSRFLVEVLVHSGVFVERQYCTFAGITHGQKTTDFLRRLVERGYARPIQVGALHRGRRFTSTTSRCTPPSGRQTIGAGRRCRWAEWWSA
jgi:hypothetical protein